MAVSFLDFCALITVGVSGATFVCGKAEGVLPSMIAKERAEVIAIADPPRSGLRKSLRIFKPGPSLSNCLHTHTRSVNFPRFEGHEKHPSVQ